jgi:hypothetical protein
MKAFAILTIPLFASLGLADVQQFTDSNCYVDRNVVDSKAGNCYEVGNSSLGFPILSIKGCSVSHDLRIYAESGCRGASNTKPPQKCASFGGNTIRSFKCL